MKPPPPPPSADPHYLHHHQRPPRHPGPWFSNQFQYRPSHSLSPPPPRRWLPHSDHLNLYQLSGYTSSPPPSYPHPYQNQFHPPPSPYSPPPPHPHSQFPHGYSQEWGNPSRGHRQAYPDKEQFAYRNENSYGSMPFPTSSTREGLHHAQSAISAVGRSTLVNQQYVYGSQSADLQSDISDQPLDFAPRFTRDHNPNVHASYSHSNVGGPIRGVDTAATMPSSHTWPPPVAPSFTPIPHVSSIAVPSPGPVHTEPPFGGFPGPSFQPTVSSAGTPYVLGAGNVLHPITAFPGDASGISGVSECPKKTPVHNRLRVEIIQKKALVKSSSQEHLKEKTPPSIEDEGVGRFTMKGDQGDSRSIESSRSTEEDNDEANVEAARTAAINSKIKSILTEVLSKVTDELFDEIATKVVSEDDVDHMTAATHLETSTSPPAVPTAKASAKVLIPLQAKEINTETVSGKSNSGSLVDVLSLAHYASDEDNEEDEIKSSSKPKSRTSYVHTQSGIERLSENKHDAVQNGSSEVEKNAMGASKGTNLIESNNNHSVVSNELSSGRDTRELDKKGSVDAMHSSEISENKDSKNNVDGKIMSGTNWSSFKDTVEERVIMKFERPSWNSDVKKLPTEDPRGKETRIKPDKSGWHESKRSSSRNDLKERESGKIRPDEKGEENHRRQDEKRITKDLTDDLNGSKHRMKEEGVWTGKKVKHSYSRKWSTHHSVKEEREETERPHMTSAKEDDNKKRGRTKDGEDRWRHKIDSSRQKRRCSSSVSSWGRNSKGDQTNGSNNETSEDFRRKLHTRKHNVSPSPIRSRRQVSRSPYYRHSQCRHSPYSSHENTRQVSRSPYYKHSQCRHPPYSSHENTRQVSRSPYYKHSQRRHPPYSSHENTRQVSRSPYYKHSQSRHSPYSSHENTRRRRSRSKSPMWRQR